jgi:hypothetical protein
MDSDRLRASSLVLASGERRPGPRAEPALRAFPPPFLVIRRSLIQPAARCSTSGSRRSLVELCRHWIRKRFVWVDAILPVTIGHRVFR